MPRKNSFFVMPYQKHARITVTNDGTAKVDAFYFNVDYRSCSKPLSPDTLYFHAQYRQATPAHGWTSDWSSNGDPKVNYRPNLSGEDNYVWLEARGQGHFVGVTMSILQNQEGWWGEGDDMFFIDGESRLSINGTGSEDYFLGAWGFGSHSFGYRLYGAPVKGSEQVDGRTSVYRFHLDSPIPFTKLLSATLSMILRITAPIIGSPLPIGTNPSLMHPSPLSLQSTTASRASLQQAGRAAPSLFLSNFSESYGDRALLTGCLARS